MRKREEREGGTSSVAVVIRTRVGEGEGEKGGVLLSSSGQGRGGQRQSLSSHVREGARERGVGEMLLSSPCHHCRCMGEDETWVRRCRHRIIVVT